MSMESKKKTVGVKIIKAPVQKADAPLQITRSELYAGEWLTPEYDMRGLENMVKQSTIIPQCIRAYKNNIAGFGLAVRYKEDTEETPEMAAEFTRAQEVIELLNTDMDTKEVFEDLIEAREIYGIAYLEVIRNIAGEVVQIEFVKETPSIAKTRPLEPYVDSMFYHHGKQTQRKKRFCKYRQSIGGKTVYFKEFGDPRIMDMRNGNYLGKKERLELEYQANEIMEFAIGTKPYGEVRWLGQVLGIDGSRRAEILNNNYFINGRHTPLMIMIEGGTLTDESFEKLTRYMEDIKGEAGQHAFMVLETEATASGTAVDAEEKPRITVKDIASILQEDGLFQTYLDNNRRKIQSAFQLPDLYVAYTTDFNRATAQTAQEVTEEQVFQPERKSIAWALNNRLLNGYAFKYVEVYFKEPDITNPDDLFKLLTVANNAGGLTPNFAKQIVFDAYGEQAEDYPEEWGDVPLAYSKAQQPQTDMGSLALSLNNSISKAAEEHDHSVVAVMREVKGLLNNGFTNNNEQGIIKAGFKESDHPRDEDGQFKDKPGGGAGAGILNKPSQADLHKELDAKIESGELSIKLSVQKQNKHVVGTKEYKRVFKLDEPQSELTIDFKETQKLINKYVKTGEVKKNADGSFHIKFKHTENIGFYCGVLGKTRLLTDRGKIHFKKTGAHIVPDVPDK